MDNFPPVTLIQPTDPASLAIVRELFLEYSKSLGVNLEFQDFENELATLPGDYAEPRGAILLALVDGSVAGCCALRPLDTSDYPNAAEMKRLYVRKAFRGFGLGQQLADGMLDAARRAGYACVLLDTLAKVQPFNWASSVSASLTSNWPGASLFNCTTLPSFTSME